MDSSKDASGLLSVASQHSMFSDTSTAETVPVPEWDRRPLPQPMPTPLASPQPAPLRKSKKKKKAPAANATAQSKRGATLQPGPVPEAPSGSEAGVAPVPPSVSEPAPAANAVPVPVHGPADAVSVQDLAAAECAGAPAGASESQVGASEAGPPDTKDDGKETKQLSPKKRSSSRKRCFPSLCKPPNLQHLLRFCIFQTLGSREGRPLEPISASAKSVGGEISWRRNQLEAKSDGGERSLQCPQQTCTVGLRLEASCPALCPWSLPLGPFYLVHTVHTLCKNTAPSPECYRLEASFSLGPGLAVSACDSVGTMNCSPSVVCEVPMLRVKRGQWYNAVSM